MRMFLTILVAATTACLADGPDLRFGPDAGALTVTTSAAEYTLVGNPGGIVATLSNQSGVTLYSNIGDGFGGPLQDNLFIATGTDAVLQRETAPGTWVTVEVGTLIEGSRTVALAAGRQYQLSGGPIAPVAGTHRIRVRFFGSPDRAGTPLEAISNTFIVR